MTSDTPARGAEVGLGAGPSAATDPPAAADMAATAPARRRPRIDPRYLPPMLITLILLGSNAATGMLESPGRTALAIGTAIVFELVLSWLLRRKWPHLASAYISGISVGILVRSPYYWPFAVTSGLSIVSKYLFTYRGRHVFNPSNFAIVMMLLVASPAMAVLMTQWGNQLGLMLPIWAIGLLVLYRLRRLHVTLTYIASFVLFAAVRVPITGHSFAAEVAPLTGPMYQLFALFMVTDPPTTLSTRNRRMLVVFLVAAMECLLRLFQIVHAPFYALFLVGPPALILERWWQARAQAAADAAGPAAAGVGAVPAG